MSSAGWNVEALLEPITAEHPCGESLEDLPPLTTLDTMRLFGQSRSLDAPPDPNEQRKAPDWGDIRALSLEGLLKSKDLRLLGYFGTAALRTDGLTVFCEALSVAAGWLEAYWNDLYPVVDEDAIARRNALNCFADPMAVLERLRRTPVVESRQHGRFSLRDIDIAKGTLQPSAGEERPEWLRIEAALGETPTESLARLQQCVADALAALRRIDAKMRDEGGTEVAPDLGPLSTQLARLNVVLQEQLALRVPEDVPAEEGDASAGGAAAGGGRAVGAPGSITSRQDVTRAIDAIIDFYKRAEPSSPVPLLLERAKRLVSKNFLEVLEDIAPEGLSGARSVGGLREGDG